MARAWLQHLRDSAIFKVEGLDPTQLRWQPTPAANSLGGHCGAPRLHRAALAPGHLLPASRWTWPGGPTCSSSRKAGAPRRPWRSTGRRAPQADAVLDQAASLDLPSRGEFRPTTFRWAVFHLIEEAARHVGHMDITRELLDGSVGPLSARRSPRHGIAPDRRQWCARHSEHRVPRRSAHHRTLPRAILCMEQPVPWQGPRGPARRAGAA